MDLPEHDHCQYCGDPVPFDQAYCSMECYNAHQEEKKKAKRKDMAIAFLAAAGVIVILVVGYIFRAALSFPPRLPVGNLFSNNLY